MRRTILRFADFLKDYPFRTINDHAYTPASQERLACKNVYLSRPRWVNGRHAPETDKDWEGKVLKEAILRALAESDVDYCEIRLEESDRTLISYRGPVMEVCDRSAELGGNVRALYKGAWGFTSFNGISDLPEKVRLACKQAHITGDLKNGRSQLASVPVVHDEVPLQVIQDPRDVSLADKVALLGRYNKLILDYHPSIKSTSVYYFDEYRRITFANSAGTYIVQEKSDLGCNLTPIASNGTLTTQRTTATGGSNGFQVMLGLEDDIKKACQTAVGLLDAQPVKGGQYTVVLDPDLAGVFIHEAFGHLSEADDVADNENLKKLMTLGTRFGSDILNVYDSGLESGHRGVAKYDDEGVAMQRTPLIQSGILVGRLHSRESAAKMGEQPTGSARALNYSFPPICRMRATYIEQGETPFEEMIKDIPLGVYAVGAYGGETNGEMFTFTAAEGYMIRDGKIAELVRDVTLTGNLMTTLMNIEMIGNDKQLLDNAGGCGKGAQVPLPTCEGSPHIRIKNVTIGGVK